MNLKDLYYFTGKCLTPDQNPNMRESIRIAFSRGLVPIETFLLLCSNHFVLPAIYVRFKRSNLLNVLPADLVEHLKEIYELNAERNNLITGQVRELCLKLKEKNIEPLFLKGTGNLLDKLYADNGERMIGDIDFLVKEQNYQECIRLVMELGYRNERKVYDNIKTLKHYPRLFRADVPADVEIHHLPVPEKYSKKFSSPLLFQDKKQIKDIQNSYVLSDEHKMIINFIHGQLNDKGYLYKITSLRDVYDYYMLSQRISPEQVAPNIEHSRKAKAWFYYAQQILNQPGPVSFNTRCSRFHVLLSDLALKHLRIFAAYRVVLKLFDLIFIRYGLRIIHSFYQRSSREFIWERLKDREWYGAHFNSLKKLFD